MDIPCYRYFNRNLYKMLKYTIPFLSLALIASVSYALSIETDPSILVERENRKAVLSCLEDTQSLTGSAQLLQREIEKCSKIGLKTIT